jgi:coenzyme F420-reducing hydrogenase beta subunit
MKALVIRDIVENDLCIGCGLCAACCPSGILEMEWNRFGEYNPVEKIPCEKECGLCLKVCPFADGNENEDSFGQRLYGNIPRIRHRSETGYYLESYVGYAPHTRERGSSGGMATWLLSTLLKKGIVDYVIAVIPNDDPDKLFRYAILPDPESVMKSAGSAYYPVELSGVLKEILDKTGRCAVIGVPCFIKAIRLAAQKNTKVRDRIFITVGLVCGQLKSKHYTEYISALSGVHEPLQKVFFRGKSPEKPAGNFYFSCTSTGGATGKIFWRDGVAEAFQNRWFTPNACNFCDDIFAECADVTCMDAWLSEYSKNYKGTSLVLVRSVQIQNIIVDGINSEEVNLKIIPLQKVIQSQPDGIEEKRINLSYQLYLNTYAGIFSPQKRIKPVKITDPFLKKKLLLTNTMQRTSRSIWAEHNNDVNKMKIFRNHMNNYLTSLSRWNWITGKCEFPVQCIQKIEMEIWRFFP